MITKKIIFQYTHDESNSMDTSYISFKESLPEPSEGKAVGQIRVDPENHEVEIDGVKKFRGEIIIDVNEEGNIIGIEILGNVVPENLKK